MALVMSNTVSETALINSNVFSLDKLKCIHCLVLRDELLLIRSQILVMINSIYHVEYSVRNSLGKLEMYAAILYSLPDVGTRASPNT